MKDNITVQQALDYDKKIDFLENIMSWSGGHLPPECEFYKYLEYNVSEDEHEYFEKFCNDMSEDEVSTLQELYNNSPKLKTMLQSCGYTKLIDKLEANGTKIGLDSIKAKTIALQLEEQIKKSLDSLSETDLNDLSRVLTTFSLEVYDLMDKARYNSKSK